MIGSHMTQKEDEKAVEEAAVRIAANSRDEIEQRGELRPAFRAWVAQAMSGLVAVGEPEADITSIEDQMAHVLRHHVNPEALVIVHDVVIERENNTPQPAVVILAATKWWRQTWLIRYHADSGKTKCGPLERVPLGTFEYMEKVVGAIWGVPTSEPSHEPDDSDDDESPPTMLPPSTTLH